MGFYIYSVYGEVEWCSKADRNLEEGINWLRGRIYYNNVRYLHISKAIIVRPTRNPGRTHAFPRVTAPVYASCLRWVLSLDETS